MRWTKKWGTVSGGAELYMLNHAEHTHERMQKKKPMQKNAPAFNVKKSNA